MNFKEFVKLIKTGQDERSLKKARRGKAVGFGIGTLIGAASALLLAKKEGKETRKDIALAAKKAADVTKKKTDEIKHKMEGSCCGFKEKIKDLSFCKKNFGSKKEVANKEAANEDAINEEAEVNENTTKKASVEEITTNKVHNENTEGSK